MTRPALPPQALPTVYPDSMRDAALVETALRDVARGLAAREPLLAHQLLARASRVVQAASAAHAARLAGLSARGRWCRRPWKSGPLVRPGRTHVSVFGTTWSTEDTRHQVMCGRVLTGRDVDFGLPATPAAQVPAGWDDNVCPECVDALAAMSSAVPA